MQTLASSGVSIQRNVRHLGTGMLLLGLLLQQHKALADTIDRTGQAPYERCGYCHEYDGNTRMGNYPKLAGQNPAYIAKQLRDFRIGVRKGQMNATAELLSDEEIEVVAAYFSQHTLKAATASVSEPDHLAASQLYLQGDARRGLPACISCHAQTSPPAEMPRLPGQHAVYLQGELERFKRGERVNDPAGQMRAIAVKLSDHEMTQLANYLSVLPPLQTVGGQN